MSFIPYVSDDILISSVKKVLDTARQAKARPESDIYRNVIDPFSTMFQMAGFEISSSQWKEAEIRRQSEKTLQNAVGFFHQDILTSVSGWSDPQDIVDIKSDSKRIIAEIKNKHNTVSGADLFSHYNTLRGLIEGNLYLNKKSCKGYTSYFVKIIPKSSKRFDKVFTPSNNKQKKRCEAHNKVREIDGASFYTIVTGRQDALRELHESLPNVIEFIIEKEIKNGNKKYSYKTSDITFLKDLFDRAYSD